MEVHTWVIHGWEHQVVISGIQQSRKGLANRYACTCFGFYHSYVWLHHLANTRLFSLPLFVSYPKSQVSDCGGMIVEELVQINIRRPKLLVNTLHGTKKCGEKTGLKHRLNRIQ